MSTRFKHLFFDLDNTILDFDHASHESFASLLNEKKYNHPDAYQVFKIVNSGVWKEFENGKITAIELRSKRFDLFLEQMDWKGKGAEWNKLYLENLIVHTKFVPGAQTLLKNLSINYKIHIVTNGLREVQRPRITTAELDGLISSITVSDEIGSAKPQIEFFNVASNNAGNPDKSEILMIGDNYSSDIIGAHNYGVQSCWFNFKNEKIDNGVHNFAISQIVDLNQII